MICQSCYYKHWYFDMATQILHMDSNLDSIESLTRESELLKTKLSQEREQLNDVKCLYCFVNLHNK